METSEPEVLPPVCPWAGVCGKYTEEEIVVIMAVMEWLGIGRFDCVRARACLNLIRLFYGFCGTR